MNVPTNLKYTQDHEWALIEGEYALIGITDYAQSQLGDIVFIELPAIGTAIQQGASLGTIEAVKTVADVFAPLSGEVVEVNTALKDAAELMNKDPYGEGWFARLKLTNPAEVANLLNPADYQKLIG
jgi:glycine cleavage system H protein